MRRRELRRAQGRRDEDPIHWSVARRHPGLDDDSVIERIKSAVLNVPGVGWLDIIENTNTIALRCPLVDGLIAAGVLTGDHWNPNGTPADQSDDTGLCTTEAWKAQPGYRQFAVIGRWVLDPADPANFTKRLAANRFLIQEVVGDLVVPNIATENQAKLSGVFAAGMDANPSIPPTTASPAIESTRCRTSSSATRRYLPMSARYSRQHLRPRIVAATTTKYGPRRSPRDRQDANQRQHLPPHQPVRPTMKTLRTSLFVAVGLLGSAGSRPRMHSTSTSTTPGREGRGNATAATKTEPSSIVYNLGGSPSAKARRSARRVAHRAGRYDRPTDVKTETESTRDVPSVYVSRDHDWSRSASASTCRSVSRSSGPTTRWQA